MANFTNDFTSGVSFATGISLVEFTNATSSSTTGITSAELDNATLKATHIGIRLAATQHLSHSADEPINVYIVYALDGTNYAIPLSVSSQLQQASECGILPDATIYTIGDITSFAPEVIVKDIILQVMPFKFKICFVNATSQDFTYSAGVTGVTVQAWTFSGHNTQD